MSERGKLYMMPMTLGENNFEKTIPKEVLDKIKETRFFIVENIKTTRRFLRNIDKQFPIDDSQFFELNKRTDVGDLPSFLNPIYNGNDVGVFSEAGCPGIADPGAEIVSIAHEKGIQVIPFVGPSSILLGLISSGFNGQRFKFHGYLPKERKARIIQLKNMERGANSNETQIFMDTPFRNTHILDDILECLKETTKVCIAANITNSNEVIMTKTVSEWREANIDLDKLPVMFLLGT